MTALRHVWRSARILFLLLVLANCSTARSRSVDSGPPTLRLGYFPNVTHAVALVGTARADFQNALGPAVTLDVKTFNAGPAMIEALFAGELDIGYIGPNPAINGFVRSKGDALRVIAGAASGGALLIVRPEANITAPADLAGKTLATPQVAGTQDVALRYYITKHGLQTADRGGTVTVMPTENPTILTLFQQGRIDGAWVPEPWATRLQLEANGRVFVDERTLWPDGKFVSTNVIVSRAYLAAHPERVTAFLRGHVAAVEYIQQNPTEAQALVGSEIARITTKPLPPAVIAGAFSTTSITYDPLPPTLFAAADHAFELGFLGIRKPNLDGIYALEPLNAVLQERGLPPVRAS